MTTARLGSSPSGARILDITGEAVSTAHPQRFDGVIARPPPPAGEQCVQTPWRCDALRVIALLRATLFGLAGCSSVAVLNGLTTAAGYVQHPTLPYANSPCHNAERTVRPHWRRGHFRRIRYGEGHRQSRIDWIRPTLVNADEAFKAATAGPCSTVGP